MTLLIMFDYHSKRHCDALMNDSTHKSPETQLTDPPSERQDTFLLTQYSSLREEVLKRIEIQHQIIFGAMVAVGTILTVGTQPDAASILLIYPFLSMFLTLAWSQNDHRNRQITRHLALHEEVFLTHRSLGWESSRSSSRLWLFGSRKVFAARGIFVGSQILVVLLFWIKARAANQPISAEDTILIIADLFIIIITVLLIGFPSRKQTTSE